MLKKTIKLSLFLFLLSVSLFAKENKTYTVDFMPKLGSVYEYEISSNTTVYMEENENDFFHKMSEKITLKYEVQDILDDGDFVLSVTIPKVYSSFEFRENPEEDKYVDSSEQDLDYTKVSFDVLISKYKIKDIDYSKLDEISDDYDKNLIYAFLKHVEDTMLDIPQKEISVNDTWDEIEEMDMIVSTSIKTTSKVVSVDDDVLEISEKIKMFGEGVIEDKNLSLKAKGHGNSSYNMHDGLLMRAMIKLNAHSKYDELNEVLSKTTMHIQRI